MQIKIIANSIVPRLRWLAVCLPFVFLFNSCTDNGSHEKAPDVSNIKLSLQTSRFDLDLYAIDSNHIADGLQKLHAKYPDFLNYFLDTLMAYGIHGNYNDTVAGIREGLRPFLVFKDFKDLEDSIKVHYPNTKDLDAQLEQGFKVMKHYLPAYPVPKIIYLNMGLSSWRAFTLDTGTLCIGLDMFLGDNYPFYNSIGVPEYMRSHCRKEYIPVAVFSALHRERYPFKPDEKNLLDLMMQRGKEQYFIHKVLPELPDTVLFGFTKTQIDWCNNNELLVYNFFTRNNLFYSNDPHSVMPYVTDGPFARGIEPVTDTVKVTPGNIGTWLGYKIISAYMAQHPQLTLEQLLTEQKEPAQILSEAKYKPRDK